MPGGYVVKGYDYPLLKRFIIATLWRASTASHPFFSRVDIGTEFESKARKMLLAAEPSDAQDFGALLSVWADADFPLFMDPFKERIFGVATYRFYLGRLVAYIKVDGRPFPSNLKRGLLRPGEPLEVISRDFARSKEGALAHRIRALNAPVLPKTFLP